MDKNTLIELTADIVSAHAEHNRVEIADLPRVIQTVYDALAGAGQPDIVAEPRPEPAVPIRSSLKGDAIICLECGARMKMLKRHLSNDHGLSPADYRKRWDLPGDYPMITPAYAEKRRSIAKSIGLGRKQGVEASATKMRSAPDEEANAGTEAEEETAWAAAR
jgi:predicted transcriptional regulator